MRATNGGGLVVAVNGGSGLRMIVGLWRIRGCLGLGRRSDPLVRYVEVPGIG